MSRGAFKNNSMEFPLHQSKYFDVREFVDKKTWDLLGTKAASLIDPKIVRICDWVRELSGVPITINNWHTGGKYDSSGFRPIWDKTGATLSQHRCGRAADLKGKGLKPADLYTLIIENKPQFQAVGLTTIEDLADTPTWLHLDCRPRVAGWHPETWFLIVKP